MATIDYKQKIKDYMNSSEVDTLYKSMLSNLFPELKESKESKDEKIIERIKKAVTYYWSDELLHEILVWLEKQGEQTSDKIVEKARTEKQRILLTETDGSANIDWDCRSLDDVKVLLKCGLEFIRTIEADKQILPDSRFGGCSFRVPTRYDKGIKQGEQKPDDLKNWYVCDMEVVNENMVTAFRRGEIYYCPKDGYLDVRGALFEVGCLDVFRLATEKEIPQPKQEWSEEDEKMLKRLCRIVHSQRVEKVITHKEESELGKWMDKWLNHNPQPHWKPSDEQMKALKHASNDCSIAFADMKILATLYEQLKALHRYEQDT